jgi:hypothetical protein
MNECEPCGNNDMGMSNIIIVKEMHQIFAIVTYVEMLLVLMSLRKEIE